MGRQYKAPLFDHGDHSCYIMTTFFVVVIQRWPFLASPITTGLTGLW